MRRRFGKTLLFLMIIVMFIFTLFGTTSAERLLGNPKANMEVSNLVPFRVIQKIALKKAQERWGHVTPGPPLASCDDDGDIVAYMFPFSIGISSFPTYSEILSSVKKGRRIAEEGLKAMTGFDQQKVMAEAKDKMKDQTARSETIHENVANKIAKKLGRERMIGSGQYGTIVVSARYDRFPIPLYMHYLPPYFCTGDLAADKAAHALSTDSVILEKIYFLDWAREQYFEFSSGGQKVLVHSYNLEVLSPETVLTRKGVKVIPGREAVPLIAEEWAKIENEIE